VASKKRHRGKGKRKGSFFGHAAMPQGRKGRGKRTQYGVLAWAEGEKGNVRREEKEAVPLLLPYTRKKKKREREGASGRGIPTRKP